MFRTIFAGSLLCGLLAATSLAAYDRVDTAAPDSEAQRLARFKLEPIADVAKAGRQVRRATYGDIWNNKTLPGVELEKTASGEVKVTITSDYGKTIDTAVLKPEAWTYVTAKDARGFAAPRATKASAPRLCDGATVIIESAQNRQAKRRDAGVCGGTSDVEAMEYGRLLAEVAVTSIPRCSGYIEPGREWSWVLRECLKRTSVRLPSNNSYGRATGAFNEPYRSFAISTQSVARAPIVDASRYE